MNLIPTFPLLDQKHDIAFSLWVDGLGENALAVAAFSVDETLNGLTRVEAALVSEDANIDLQQLVDRAATLTIHHKYLDTVRHFSGVVASVARGDTGQHRTAYHLVLLPKLSRADHTSDCRIFQAVTVIGIIRKVLSEHGVDDVKWFVSKDHVAREMAVQYRETNLAFIERIAAEEGIWRYFEHGPDGRCTLVFTDIPEVTPVCPGQAELTYNAEASGAVKGVWCSSLTFREEVHVTHYTQRDYTFKTPAYNQEHQHSAVELNGVKNNYKIFDYPGRYKHPDAGKPFTKHRLEAARVEASLGFGLSNAPHLVVGHGVTLTDHPNKPLNQKYRLLSVRHEGFQPQVFGEDGFGESATSGMASTLFASFGPLAAGSAAHRYGITGAPLVNGPHLSLLQGRLAVLAAQGQKDESAATLYANIFTAQPSRLPYRPQQLAKPLVDGPQIGHVVGPPGEEIFTDEWARVKVQFPWDRYGQSNDQSSCWIRVSQNWAGPKFGHMAIPRIGQEVIVDFLEGDPDQPIVTGRTYDANNLPPNKLPDFKTRMIIQSKTHKGNGFNELRFEDEKGEEEVWLHAEKYHNVVVKSDETWKIGGSRHKLVEGSQSEAISGDKDTKVGGDHREVIKGSNHVNINASRVGQIGISDFLKVIGDKVSHIVRNQITFIEQHFRLQTLGRQHFETGTTHYINAGANVVIQAGSCISFNVGDNFIRINDSGIQLEGTLVKVNCGGSPTEGTAVEAQPVMPPEKYAGPHAERYARSFKK